MSSKYRVVLVGDGRQATSRLRNAIQARLLAAGIEVTATMVQDGQWTTRDNAIPIHARLRPNKQLRTAPEPITYGPPKKGRGGKVRRW